MEVTRKENNQIKQNTHSLSGSLPCIMVNVTYISDTAKWPCDSKAPVFV